jgi:hypothetical protein
VGVHEPTGAASQVSVPIGAGLPWEVMIWDLFWTCSIVWLQHIRRTCELVTLSSVVVRQNPCVGAVDHDLCRSVATLAVTTLMVWTAAGIHGHLFQPACRPFQLSCCSEWPLPDTGSEWPDRASPTMHTYLWYVLPAKASGKHQGSVWGSIWKDGWITTT